MDIKQYLGQIEALNNKINKNLERVDEIRHTIYGIPAMSNDADRVQKSSDQDRMGTSIARMIDLMAETDILIDSLSDLKEIIRVQILQIPSEKHQEILFMKYFEYKSIYEIADILNMTDRGTKKAHKRALEEMEKVIKAQNVA